MAAVAADSATKELKQQTGISAAGGQFLTFSPGEELYGVDILRAQEIKGYTAATKIPNSPPPIKGVLTIENKDTQPAPEFGSTIDVTFIYGIGKFGDKLVSLRDIGPLFDPALKDTMSTAA